MFTKKYLFKVAKAIDNNFIGSESTFSCDKNNDYFQLTTNRCDAASIIRAYHNGNKLTVINRIGPDVDDWTEIHKDTYERISQIAFNDAFISR